MNYWATISKLGDVTTSSSLALGIFALFALQHAWKLASHWIMLFSVGTMAVVVSKVAFIGWGIGSQELDFTGFSGHAMRAMAIFPVLAYISVQQNTFISKVIAIISCVALGAVVGVSRFILNFHSWSEIVMGSILGLSLSFCFIYLLRNYRDKYFPQPIALTGLLPLLFMLHTDPTPTQHWIVGFSLYISGHEQPFVREGWQFSKPGQTDYLQNSKIKTFQIFCGNANNTVLLTSPANAKIATC